MTKAKQKRKTPEIVVELRRKVVALSLENEGLAADVAKLKINGDYWTREIQKLHRQYAILVMRAARNQLTAVELPPAIIEAMLLRGG